MEYRVSGMTIAVIVLVMILSAAIPVGLFLYLNRKLKLSGRPFFIGWLAFLVSAMVLERLFHMLVLSTPIGNALQNNLFLYAVYGGVVAGLFEELARYFSFSKFLKGHLDDDRTAWMYGAGHGGSEMFNLLAVTMANNLVLILTLNSQGAEALTAGASGEALTQITAVINQLCTTSPWVFLLSIAERIFALVIQIALSVLVFYSVKYPKKDRKLLLLAVELHALVDFVAVIAAQMFPAIVTELIIGLMAAFTAWFAKRVWDSNQQAT